MQFYKLIYPENHWYMILNEKLSTTQYLLLICMHMYTVIFKSSIVHTYFTIIDLAD